MTHVAVLTAMEVVGWGLWVGGCGLWVVGWGVWVVGWGLWVVGCGLWVVGWGLGVVGCGLWVGGCGLFNSRFRVYVAGQSKVQQRQHKNNCISQNTTNNGGKS